MNRLKTAEAYALRNAMLEARRALNQAYEKYQHTLELAMDIDADVDGAFALVQEGRIHAAALTRYSEATMAWLVLVEARLRAKKAGSDG